MRAVRQHDGCCLPAAGAQALLFASSRLDEAPDDQRGYG
jgi:hypothetical protein